MNKRLISPPATGNRAPKSIRKQTYACQHLYAQNKIFGERKILRLYVSLIVLSRLWRHGASFVFFHIDLLCW